MSMTAAGLQVPATRDEWQGRVVEHVDHYVAWLRSVGLVTDPRLVVVPGTMPCPLYRSDTMTIEFMLPDAVGIRNRLFWCYYATLTGSSGPDEAMAFAALLLPLISAHEVNHHLRQRNLRDTGDHFIEEQIAQLVAADWFEAHPVFSASVPDLKARCGKALRRLRRLAPMSPELEAGYRLNIAESMADRRLVSWREVHRAEHAAAVHHANVTDTLRSEAATSALEDAGLAMERAHDYFDSHYLGSVAEYWHFSMAWLVSYLTHHRRNDAAASATAHLAPR